MSRIISIHAEEILDSRGNPTLEVVCTTERGSGKAAVPSGASTGIHEALELRDGDMNQHHGKGVEKAIGNVNTEISGHIVGNDHDQASLDASLIALDGTENKSRLGANAILGVSLAFARAVADERGVELYRYIGVLSDTDTFVLPTPFFNIINGGKHADSGLDIQEYMIAPVGFATFSEKVKAGEKIIETLRRLLIEKGLSTDLGDEGGFAPRLDSNEGAIVFIEKAIAESGYSHDEVKIALDVAASSFYTDGVYALKVGEIEKDMNTADMIRWYGELVSKHPIISIEDGLAEDDWDGFTLMNKEIGEKIQIVGDDLTVTNKKRIAKAIETRAINSVLIKLNQIGTLTETLEAITMTKGAGWKPFISHRSGETLDTFIADLVVGTRCECIKAGSLTRPERVCKYERLIEIEQKLSSSFGK